MGDSHPFEASTWSEVREFLTALPWVHDEGSYLLDIIDSVIAADAEDVLAVITSMHDLWVALRPLDDPVPDHVVVCAPGSINNHPEGTVRMIYRTQSGRATDIVRPSSEAVPLFWRFLDVAFGLRRRQVDSPDAALDDDAWIPEFVKMMTRSGVAKHRQLRGLRRRVIDEIEADQGVPLPGTYRRFLKVAGRGAGRLWHDCDAFYPDIIGARRAAAELLAEDGAPFALPSDAVVFSVYHPGGSFLYTAGSGDDPAVFRWVEGTDRPVQISGSLSAFFLLLAHRT